jgi:transcriptional regulator with XRE-family HTH domain
MAKRTRKKKYVPLTEQLREIISQCGVTRYRIAQETSISEQTLSKFMSGHQKGLGPDALDELGEYLGISLVVDSSASKGQQ